VFSIPNKTKSQAWSGMLAPNRAIDWSKAGAGTIPSRATTCQTLGVAGQSSSYAQTVTAAQIVSALQACAGTNQTVLLNPGTYTMTTTLFGPGDGGAWPSNVTLRGSGANQTVLKWSSGASLNTCNGVAAVAICVFNGDSGAIQYAANILNWTGGYSQGSTSVTLGSAIKGSLSNLKVGALLQFNQLDPTTDNGNRWNCGVQPTTSGGQGCTWGGSDTYPNRSESQIVTVTGISGSTVTFTPALYAPNWSGSMTPYALFSSTLPVTGTGIENIEVNTQSLGDIQAMIETLWVTNSWVKNVAMVNAEAINAAARKHVEISSSAHITVRDSYMYGGSPSSESYGVDMLWGTSDSLVENNIAHHMATAYILETGVGDVFGYNFAADNFYTGGGGDPNWQQGDIYHHDAGDYYDLFEGHEGIEAINDDIHGTSFGITLFRDYLSGFDPANTCPSINPTCGTATKSQNTTAVYDMAYARYMNVALNVLGNGTYQNTYQNVGLSGQSSCPTYPWTTIYSENFSNGNQVNFSNNPGCVGPSTISPTMGVLDNDSLTSATLVRWGNYDTVNGSVQTNSSETASGAAVYPGLSSPSTSWSSYPSLYYTSKPVWWGSMPWPAVGPDVTGGNITNVGGHAYHNPAANCFLNVLGGKTDGSSAPLPFDANNCYSSSASSAGPPAPLNLTGTIVQ